MGYKQNIYTVYGWLIDCELYKKMMGYTVERLLAQKQKSSKLREIVEDDPEWSLEEQVNVWLETEQFEQGYYKFTINSIDFVVFQHSKKCFILGVLLNCVHQETGVTTIYQTRGNDAIKQLIKEPKWTRLIQQSEEYAEWFSTDTTRAEWSVKSLTNKSCIPPQIFTCSD